MHRTTIMLPLDLKQRAASYCEQKGISLGQLIREVLAREVEQSETQDNARDSFFADKAIYKGEVPHDLSLNHDRHLYPDSDQHDFH